MTTKVYKNQVENIFPKDDNIRELTLTVSFFRAVWRGKFSFQNSSIAFGLVCILCLFDSKENVFL
jgi:hypothetical protein